MKFWYKPRLTLPAFLLWPLSAIYKNRAQSKYDKDLEKSFTSLDALKLETPVLVVGNITVGGTGKTPMVRFLVRYLTAMGLKVAVISRGYGGSYKGCHQVQLEDPASLVGDEMAMQKAYCHRQGLPEVHFVVCKDRVKAALTAQELGVDFIIADDGLQHYRLPRHIEIAIIGPQGLGNQMFLPAGPLRESPKRLKDVDFIVNNSEDPSFGGYPVEQRNFAFVPLKAIKEKAEEINFETMIEDFKVFLQKHEGLTEEEISQTLAQVNLEKLAEDYESYFNNKAFERAFLAHQHLISQTSPEDFKNKTWGSAHAQLKPLKEEIKAQLDAQNEGQEESQEESSLPREEHNLVDAKHELPVFESAEEFLEFIDHQLNPYDMSLKMLLAKARARYYQGYVLPPLMKSFYPKCIALCAIGYPLGFQKSLESLGFEVVEMKVFKDHHAFTQSDLDNWYREHPEYKNYPLFVTEKDAIKLVNLLYPENTYFLEREAFFVTHERWLESLKNKIIKFYTNKDI